MSTAPNFDMLADITKSAAKHADRPAMVIDDKEYTYRELFRWVDAIYANLKNKEETVIGIATENKIETYASILATLLSGKTYVMLHPDFPEDRIIKIATSAGIGRFLYTEDTEKMKNLLSASLPFIRTCATKLWDEVTGCTDNKIHIPPIVSSGDNAYIIFTSGSTGAPKGVPISRDNLNAFYTAYHRLGWRLDENDRMLQMFELTFDVSVVSFLYPLTIGASVYTVPSQGFKYLNALSIMETCHLTFAAIAPSVLRLARSYFPGILLRELKYLIVTAEASDIQLLTDFRPCIPKAEIVNLYGPSEATIYCSSYTVPKADCKGHNCRY